MNHTNPNNPLFHALQQSLQVAQKEFRRAYRRKRNHGYRTWTEQLKNATPPDANKILAATQKRKNRKPNTSTLHNDPATLEKVRNHMASVAAPPNTEPIAKPPDPLNNTPKHFPQTEPLASMAEIEYAISQAPNIKATGTDNISAELLKPIATHAATWLFLLLNAIQRVGITPTEWNEVILIPLWNSKGAPDDPTQHRPISFTQHSRKTFERCIMDPLLRQAGPLDKAQGGF
jgi:hypothetical protein